MAIVKTLHGHTLESSGVPNVTQRVKTCVVNDGTMDAVFTLECWEQTVYQYNMGGNTGSRTKLSDFYIYFTNPHDGGFVLDNKTLTFAFDMGEYGYTSLFTAGKKLPVKCVYEITGGDVYCEELLATITQTATSTGINLSFSFERISEGSVLSIGGVGEVYNTVVHFYF